MHWASNYIGLPWRRGADGPEAFDCWGLVVFVQGRHFNTIMPHISDREFSLRQIAAAVKTHDYAWERTNTPLEGDIVLMARRSVYAHIGVWVNANTGGILHCAERAGVIFSKLNTLSLQGWGSVTIYHRKSV